MSVSTEVVLVGGNYITLNTDEITRTLAAKQIVGAEAEAVINEIRSGDLTNLDKYEIGAYVSVDVAASLSSKLGQIDIGAVMRVLHEAGQMMKKANREIRHEQRDAAYTLSMDAASKMKSAAGLALAAGIISGVGQIVSGAFSLWGATRGIRAGEAAGGVGEHSADAILKASEARGAITKGSFDLAAAFFTFGSKYVEAGSTEKNAEAQKMSSMENESADFQKSFQELVANVREIIKEINDAQTQANANIIRNM